MSIAGNLETMEFAELLQWLARSRKTGTLVIDNGYVEKRALFRDGTIIASASTDPHEYLGHFLVSHGFISEAELAQGMELQQKRKTLLGKILVTVGAISQDDLERMLRLKSEESIYDLFSWTEGEFRFLEDEIPEQPLVPIALDVTSLVLNGLQRLDEWRRIRESIPSAQAVPVTVGKLEVTGDEGARKVLEMVNDDRSIEEIALQTHSTEFFVSRILLAQMESGRLKVVRPRPLRGDGRGAEDGRAVDVDALLAAAEEHFRTGRLHAALRYLQAAASLSPERHESHGRVANLEKEIRDRIARSGIRPDAVPRATRSLDQVTGGSISPQEGFLLSRIDGRYDVDTILKISPMPPLEALVVLWKLLQAGHIRLER